MTTPKEPRMTQRDFPPVRFDNFAEEIIPPHAVLRIVDTDADYDHALKAFKPTGSASGATFAISLEETSVAATNGSGQCTTGYSAWALFFKESGGDPDPAPGDVVGPASDWALHAGKSGFVVVGGYETFTVGMTTYHRVRVAAQSATPVNIVIAQVDEAGGVTGGDATYAFKNAVATKGTAPPGGTGTAQNPFGESLAFEQFVLLEQGDNGNWYPDRAAGTGAVLARFELDEDMGYADEAVLAVPLLADGTINEDADTFYVIDPMPDGQGQWYGLAAFTDGDTGAAEHRGYIGVGLKITNDWDETGVPGYLILEMEGPADQLIVSLHDVVSSGSAPCTFVGGDDHGPWGDPDSARLPRIEDDAFSLTVYDDLALAGDARVGDVWWVKWDRVTERYVFWRPRTTATAINNGLFKLTSLCTAASLSSDTLTPGICTAYPLVLDDPEADPLTWTVDDEHGEYTLFNSTPDTIANGSIVQVKPIDGLRFIDVVNCSAYA